MDNERKKQRKKHKLRNRAIEKPTTQKGLLQELEKYEKKGKK